MPQYNSLLQDIGRQHRPIPAFNNKGRGRANFKVKKDPRQDKAMDEKVFTLFCEALSHPENYHIFKPKDRQEQVTKRSRSNNEEQDDNFDSISESSLKMIMTTFLNRPQNAFIPTPCPEQQVDKTFLISGIFNSYKFEKKQKGFTVKGEIQTVHDLKTAAIQKYKHFTENLELRMPKVLVFSLRRGEPPTFFNSLLERTTNVDPANFEYFVYLAQRRYETWLNEMQTTLLDHQEFELYRQKQMIQQHLNQSSFRGSIDDIIANCKDKNAFLDLKVTLDKIILKTGGFSKAFNVEPKCRFLVESVLHYAIQD